jgi:hypothetical protein
MMDWKRINNDYNNGYIKNVRFECYESYSGGFQLKDNNDSSNKFNESSWVNNENINEFEFQWGNNFNENKKIYGPHFYVGIVQILESKSFFSLLNEYIENNDIDSKDPYTYSFDEFLGEEYGFQFTSELGLLGEKIESIDLSKVKIGTSPLNDDIEFAVSDEVKDLDYKFKFEYNAQINRKETTPEEMIAKLEGLFGEEKEGKDKIEESEKNIPQKSYDEFLQEEKYIGLEKHIHVSNDNKLFTEFNIWSCWCSKYDNGEFNLHTYEKDDFISGSFFDDSVNEILKEDFESVVNKFQFYDSAIILISSSIDEIKKRLDSEVKIIKSSNRANY